MNNELSDIIELKQAQEILDKTQQGIFPTFAYSILSQYLPGQIYFDSTKKSALIGTRSGVFVTAGDERSKEFQDLLLDVYTRRKHQGQRFTLFSPSEQWRQAIGSLFGGELRQLHRYSLHFNNSKYNANTNAGVLQKKEANEPFHAGKITAESVTQSLEFNESYILEYWGSISRFLQHGFGYCLLHRDKIASECISIFASPNYAEIDIATHPDYRGMGLAHRAGELFIEHCLEHGLIPKWDCDIDNIASIKLAEKLGFDKPQPYSVFAKR